MLAKSSDLLGNLLVYCASTRKFTISGSNEASFKVATHALYIATGIAAQRYFSFRIITIKRI